MSVFTHILRVLTGDSNQNLRATEEHAQRTERALGNLESRAGRVGSAAGRLSGGLGRVSPELADLAMLTNDAADGLEVLTMGGAKALRILGPVAAAAGVAAGAYMFLKQNLDKANEAMKQANELATQNQKLFKEVSRAQDLAAVATGRMTIEELNRNNAMNQGQRLFHDRRQSLQEQLRAAEALRDAEVASFNRVATTRTAHAATIEDERKRALFIATTTQMLQAQTQAVEESQSAFNRASFNLENLNNQESQYISNLETVANSTSSATAATHQYTAAIDDAAEAVEGLLFTTQDGLTSEEALFQNATAAIQAARGEISLDEMRLKIGTADLIKQNEVAEAAAQAAFRASQRQAAMGEIAGGLGSLTSPAAALGSIGPVGAIVAGLAQVGQLGAQGVEDQMRSLVMTITAGIKALPEIFIDVLPEIGKVIVTELPRALFEAMRQLFQQLFERLSSLFGRNRLISDDGGLAVFEGTFTGNVGDQIREAIGNASSSGRVARADGATRLAISRAPTAQMTAPPNFTINALGIDDGTQDEFQRRFARYTDPNTGLRGRS